MSCWFLYPPFGWQAYCNVECLNQWQREFLYTEEEQRVLLILNMDSHLRDLELFERMGERWD